MRRRLVRNQDRLHPLVFNMDPSGIILAGKKTSNIGNRSPNSSKQGSFDQ